MKEKSLYIRLIPVMLVFFTMGFVDLVGIASNYVKLDLGLTDSEANIFPSLVFFWFLIFSVPTGMLMNKIGRKKTVMLSLVVTFVSLLIPCFGDGYMVMLVSFSLLGIGNALMQTSLNPLLSNIITGDKLASSLTFGQFVKAIALYRHVGSDCGDPFAGIGLACTVSDLYGDSDCGDFTVGGDFYQGRGSGRQTFHICRMHCLIG